MIAVFQLILLGALATSAGAQSFEVLGYAGELGEWELTATVTGNTLNQTNEFSGQLMMKHVGICTQDGPEEKSGEIRMQILQASRWPRPCRLTGSNVRTQATCRTPTKEPCAAQIGAPSR